LRKMKRRQGNITKRGKNSWQLKFDVTSPDGTRQTRYATVKGSYQDAQRELTRLLSERDRGMLPYPTSSTMTEYLRACLASSTKQSMKTLERYSELAERQIIPHLGGIKLQKLTVEQVRLWHRTLLDGGLSSCTIGNAHRFLKLVLASAVKAGTLARNVAALESSPPVKTKEIEVQDLIRSQPSLRPSRASTCILSSASRLPLACVVASCWLCRGDIDLDGAMLHVERSVEE